MAMKEKVLEVELYNERKEREAVMKEMEVALTSHKNEKEDAFKLITDLKGQVKNALWVVEDT